MRLVDAVEEILEGVLNQPTAPFCEEAVRAEILRWLAQCPHVRVDRDDFGNLIALYRRGEGVARLAYAAHMDHPGFVDDPGQNPPARRFLGGVPEVYRAKNPPTRDFGRFAMCLWR